MTFPELTLHVHRETNELGRLFVTPERERMFLSFQRMTKYAAPNLNEFDTVEGKMTFRTLFTNNYTFCSKFLATKQDNTNRIWMVIRVPMTSGTLTVSLKTQGANQMCQTTRYTFVKISGDMTFETKYRFQAG